MLNGIEASQIYLLIILAGAAILKVPVWHNVMIPRGGFDPAQAPSCYFVRSDSV